ncbi:MAG: PadR family transcriptional regulator [Brooklawnia sp.]|jgi:DNA-binding PadR family transcriptional regulator
MSLRQTTLELAILGRLAHGPSHGYEVRKHVNVVLGQLRKVSFGSLYPALRRLLDRGLICDCGGGLPRIVSGRSRRIYHLTSQGEEHLADRLASADDSLWGDAFSVQFSLLGMTDRRNRLRILRAQRDSTTSLLTVVDSWSPPAKDHYSEELVRHTRQMVGHELAWLDGLIAAEESESNKENR